MKSVHLGIALLVLLSSGMAAPALAGDEIRSNCPGIESVPVLYHEEVRIKHFKGSHTPTTIIFVQRDGGQGMSLAEYLKNNLAHRRILCVLYVPFEGKLGARFEIFSTDKQ